MSSTPDPTQRLALHNRKINAPVGPNTAEFDAGDTIFEEGDAGDRLYVVTSGLVQISKKGPRGDVPIGYVGAGEVFGELALIDDEPRMGTARAVTDVECVVLSAAGFQRMRDQANPFLKEILGVLSRNVRSLAGDWMEHNSQK